MKPRVLNIIGQRPQSGVKSVLMNFEKSFDKKFEYDFLFFSDIKEGSFDNMMMKNGRKVYILPEISISKIKNVIKELDSFFLNHINEYDIYHIHSPNVAFVVSTIIKKYDDSKIIIGHSHATKYSEKKLNSLRNAILINRKKQFSHFIACSNEAGKFITKGTKKDYKIIHNAIELKQFSFSEDERLKIRKELKVTANYCIVSVGLFNKQKNQKFIIDILEKIIQKGIDDVRVFFIGEGLMIDDIKKIVEIKKLKKYVEFLGYRDDVSKLLNAMDILVMPSLYEGLPVVGVEAIANGLPVVFSNNITKDINTKNTRHCDLSDLNSWVETIMFFKSNNNKILKDRSNQKELSDLGFDISVEQDTLYNYYLDLLVDK